jgi:hypothetical protein
MSCICMKTVKSRGLFECIGNAVENRIKSQAPDEM